MTRWTLTGNDVSRFLGVERLVHPVKFDGKVWSFGAPSPRLRAGPLSCEIKFENAPRRFDSFERTGRVGPPEGAAPAPGVLAGRGGRPHRAGPWRRRRSRR